MENRWSIEKHLLQNSRLPEAVLQQVKGERLRLYAHYDLDNSLEYRKHWLVIGGENIYLFSGDAGQLIKQFPLSKVSRTSLTRLGSYEELKLFEADDMPPLAIVRFSGKQRGMMGQIKWFLDEVVKSKNEADFNFCPHEVYQTQSLAVLEDVQAESAGNSQNTLFRLLAFLRPYKSYVFFGSLGAVGATALSLLPPFLSGRLIDELIRPYQNGELSSGLALEAAWPLVIMLGGSYILKEFCAWLRLNRMSLMGEFVARDLREKLYAHLQTLDMDYFGKKPTGSLISRVSSDTDRIWDFIAFGVVEVSIAVVTLIGLSATLISLDWKLGILMTLPVPILLWSIYSHGQRMKGLFTKCWRKWSDITAVLSDTIPGMQVVKAFAQQGHEVKRFNKRNELATSQFEDVHKSWTKFWPGLMLAIHTIVIAAWASAIPRIFTDGETSLSAGTFVSFLLYMTMFSQPIEVIGQMARMMNRAISSAHRIFEVLDTKAKIVSPENGRTIEDLKGEIEFRNVDFSYDGVRRVLKNVSFKIHPGEMIGLVGSSGGGKSTITKLITRFYDCNKGGIFIDGVSLKELELDCYRKKVGMVLQEPYLFQGTIWENIAYGLKDVAIEDVIEAARVANAHDFIMRLPNGYETIIGERGHTLSGGERQRVSIARAILHDPKILILDEATSAVDTETERKIQDALDKLIEGRTVIAVAHRLSTLRKANRIFVVKKGEIVESGTHSELLKKEDGHYVNLHKMQLDLNESFV